MLFWRPYHSDYAHAEDGGDHAVSGIATFFQHICANVAANRTLGGNGS
jgi:predicted esterase YcpF (UPF0227 family)